MDRFFSLRKLMDTEVWIFASGNLRKRGVARTLPAESRNPHGWKNAPEIRS